MKLCSLLSWPTKPLLPSDYASARSYLLPATGPVRLLVGAFVWMAVCAYLLNRLDKTDSAYIYVDKKVYVYVDVHVLSVRIFTQSSYIAQNTPKNRILFGTQK